MSTQPFKICFFSNQDFGYHFLIHLTAQLKVSYSLCMSLQRTLPFKLLLQLGAGWRGGKQSCTSEIILIRTDLESRLCIPATFWNCVFWTPLTEWMNFQAIYSAAISLWHCYPEFMLVDSSPIPANEALHFKTKLATPILDCYVSSR